MITSKADLRKTIRTAETAAAALRTPGHRFNGTGEREVIAGLLEELANIARRAFDPNWQAHIRDKARVGAIVPSTADVGEYAQAELDDMGVAQ